MLRLKFLIKKNNNVLLLILVFINININIKLIYSFCNIKKSKISLFINFIKNKDLKKIFKFLNKKV